MTSRELTEAELLAVEQDADVAIDDQRQHVVATRYNCVKVLTLKAMVVEIRRLRKALAMSEKFRRRYYEGKLKLYEMADDKITRAVMACLPCSEGPLDSECRELLAEKGGAS